MKIQNGNTGMYMKGATEAPLSRREKAAEENAKRKSVYAGGLNLADTKLEQTKRLAQKQALKVVGDAFGSRQKVDQDVSDRSDRVKSLLDKIKEDRDGIESVEEEKERLKEAYGIDEKGLDEKDKEIIEKNSIKLPGNELTEEEKERLEELTKNGMVDYYKELTNLNKTQSEYKKRIEDNMLEIKIENAVIRGINKELVKDQSMLQAHEQSQEIMDAASKEIIGMLKQDAVDHVDEEQEKAQEAAKDKAEEKKEQEETIEAAKEKAEEMEALAEHREVKKENKKDVNLPTDEILDLEGVDKKVQSDIQNIVSEMKLVAEDIKGSMVDKKI